MFAAFLTAAVIGANLPREAVVSCATWDGLKTTKLQYHFETLDGKVFDGEMELFAGSDPGGPRFALRSLFALNKWRYECLDHYVVVIRGSATSPLRSVSFQSDGWLPVYYYRPAPGWLPLAPKPREVKR
jgi:hypothetical protein